jgi:hypothetical protein
MLCNYTSLNYYLEVSLNVGKNFKVEYEIEVAFFTYASVSRLSVRAEPSLAV